MPVRLTAALLAAAQAASSPAPTYGPAAAPTAVPTAGAVKQAERECQTPTVPDQNSREIVVCAVKPNGYRIDPDILAARRLKKKGDTVHPRNPHETFADHSCATVGPMGCRGQPTINVLAAAAALATMADRLSKGQEIGSMFKTDPSPTEYQLYLEAKREREEAEADKAAKAKAAAAQAAADAAPAHQ
jgi:hypothetical protein